MYQSGVAVTEIMEVTGCRAIYAILRRAGLGPSRQIRHRTPSDHIELRRRCIEALTRAGRDLDTDWLGIVEYRQWRRSQPDQKRWPGEAQICSVLGPWKDAAATAGLLAGKKRLVDNPDCSESTAVGWIVAAADGAPKLSRTDYNKWRTNHPEALSAWQLHQRFEWANLLSKAGIGRAKGRSNIYSDAELADVLHQAAALYPGLTITEYKKWRAAQPHSHPSQETIRARYRTWAAALKANNITPP